jgi:hypothetical protein
MKTSNRAGKIIFHKALANFSIAPHYYRFIRNSQLTLHPVEHSKGQPRPGTEKGPDVLLKMNLVAGLEALGWKVNLQAPLRTEFLPMDPEDQNKTYDIQLHNDRLVGNLNKHLWKQAAVAAKSQSFSLSLGM